MRRIAPQQYRIAVQQRQAIILMGIAAMRSERQCPEVTNYLKYRKVFLETRHFRNAFGPRRGPIGPGYRFYIATRKICGARRSGFRRRNCRGPIDARRQAMVV
jgi:hypothetical protein